MCFVATSIIRLDQSDYNVLQTIVVTNRQTKHLTYLECLQLRMPVFVPLGNQQQLVHNRFHNAYVLDDVAKILHYRVSAYSFIKVLIVAFLTE